MITCTKIPQWAIRQTLEGANQPKDVNQRHPDLRPDVRLAAACRPDAKLAKTQEQIESDLKALAQISPMLRNVLNETSFKRVNVNSDQAVHESIHGQETFPLMEGGRVQQIRDGHTAVNTPSRFAASMPGCGSVVEGFGFDYKPLSTSDTLMEMISKQSRESNKESRLTQAAYLSKHKYSDDPEENHRRVLEAQRAKKTGERDDRTGMRMGTVISTNQLGYAEKPDSDAEIAHSYAMFQKTQARLTNKLADVQIGNKKISGEHLAESLKNYFNGKVAKRFADTGDWRQTATSHLEERLTKASEKSHEIVSDMGNDRRNRGIAFAEGKAFRPDYEMIAEAMDSNKRMVSDSRQDTIDMSRQRVASIRQERDSKQAISVSAVTKPTTSVVDSMLKSLASVTHVQVVTVD
jgi:hypothetical protein